MINKRKIKQRQYHNTLYPLLDLNKQHSIVQGLGTITNPKVSMPLFVLLIFLVIGFLFFFYFYYETEVCFMDYNNPDTPLDDHPFCLTDFKIINRIENH